MSAALLTASVTKCCVLYWLTLTSVCLSHYFVHSLPSTIAFHHCLSSLPFVNAFHHSLLSLPFIVMTSKAGATLWFRSSSLATATFSFMHVMVNTNCFQAARAAGAQHAQSHPMHIGATPQQGLPTPQHRPGTPSTMPVAANGHEGFAGESGAAATPGELLFFCSACHSLLQLCNLDNGLYYLLISLSPLSVYLVKWSRLDQNCPLRV